MQIAFKAYHNLNSNNGLAQLLTMQFNMAHQNQYIYYMQLQCTNSVKALLCKRKVHNTAVTLSSMHVLYTHLAQSSSVSSPLNIVFTQWLSICCAASAQLPASKPAQTNNMMPQFMKDPVYGCKVPQVPMCNQELYNMQLRCTRMIRHALPIVALHTDANMHTDTILTVSSSILIWRRLI